MNIDMLGDIKELRGKHSGMQCFPLFLCKWVKYLSLDTLGRIFIW